jgi:hypothetical protein
MGPADPTPHAGASHGPTNGLAKPAHRADADAAAGNHPGEIAEGGFPGWESPWIDLGGEG